MSDDDKFVAVMVWAMMAYEGMTAVLGDSFFFFFFRFKMKTDRNHNHGTSPHLAYDQTLLT